jgi:hypothetical protein
VPVYSRLLVDKVDVSAIFMLLFGRYTVFLNSKEQQNLHGLKSINASSHALAINSPVPAYRL